jgi:hypothetical protein
LVECAAGAEFNEFLLEVGANELGFRVLDEGAIACRTQKLKSLVDSLGSLIVLSDLGLEGGAARGLSRGNGSSQCLGV